MHGVPAAQQSHEGIRNKPACKATLQRLQLMALDEHSTLLLITRVVSCIADSAVASCHLTGPLMYTVPGLHSIYMPQLVHDIPECCVVASGMPPASRGLCFISTNYYIETCCNSWGGGGGLQLAWLQSVGYFKAGCHWPVNDENICVNAEHLGHCSSMSLKKAAWCVPPQVACALNVDVPPFRMNSGLGNDKVLHSAWQLLHCMF